MLTLFTRRTMLSLLAPLLFLLSTLTAQSSDLEGGHIAGSEDNASPYMQLAQNNPWFQQQQQQQQQRIWQQQQQQQQLQNQRQQEEASRRARDAQEAARRAEQQKVAEQLQLRQRQELQRQQQQKAQAQQLQQKQQVQANRTKQLRLKRDQELSKQQTDKRKQKEKKEADEALKTLVIMSKAAAPPIVASARVQALAEKLGKPSSAGSSSPPQCPPKCPASSSEGGGASGGKGTSSSGGKPPPDSLSAKFNAAASKPVSISKATQQQLAKPSTPSTKKLNSETVRDQSASIMRNAQLDSQAKQALQRYEAGAQGQMARELAPQFAKMSASEFLKFMKAQTDSRHAAARLYAGPSRPMIVWEYKDGTVVRYKPTGDAYGRDYATYSVEVKKDPDIPDSEAQLDGIAFKVDSAGRPLPKRPGDMPHGSSKAEIDQVMKKTHLGFRE